MIMSQHMQQLFRILLVQKLGVSGVAVGKVCSFDGGVL